MCFINLRMILLLSSGDLIRFSDFPISQSDKNCWTKVFTIAACVHLCGITFYGIFASGDLQSWAEPTLEEQKAWDPVAASTIKETSFVSSFLSLISTHDFPIYSFLFWFYSQNDPDAMNMQINHTKQVSYGAVEQLPPSASNPFNQNPTANNFAPNPGNPFAFPNTIQEEPVQPYATDAYMHGTVEDRGFREY